MDDPSSSWSVLLISILLGLSAFFSGSETAFFSLDSLRLKKIQDSGGPSSKTILSLLSAPRKLLVTILLGNETVNIAATSLATALAIDLFGDKGTGLAIGVMLFLVLIFGEITPKTIAVHYPSQFVLRAARPLSFFHRLIAPLGRFVQAVVDTLSRPFLPHPAKSEALVTEAEFHTLVEIGEADGILESAQHEMIKNTLEFTETTVAEVMTPREDIFCLPIEESLNSAIKKIKKKLFARVPVYEGNLNRIKGVLYTKDLLIQQHRISPPQAIRDLIHSPYFVSSQDKVVDLLRDLQKNRIHLAIVVDKAGETAGLVSLEDLLEELFGEIAGEAKSKARLWRKLGPDRYLVSAMMHTEDFNQRTGSQIDEEENDTLGGMLQELFGPRPWPGEKKSYQGIEFTVQRVKGRRILEVVVQTPPCERKKD